MKTQNKLNDTDLPENLKKGLEDLSGRCIDDVKVHYNAGKPDQLHTEVFNQESNIQQENHLPHEAWHVVQQKQGKVKPTGVIQPSNINLNEDETLEKIADEMGEKALKQSK
ncbi:hypothetical protein [Pedobacter nototheniae]|uniref:hypothetical protein n=1 Tax=Pedobacter nototheniae TaxID=2488994 RepID=UPI00292F3185|nr:hypothetical protein [Pedobacter nototheniae]